MSNLVLVVRTPKDLETPKIRVVHSGWVFNGRTKTQPLNTSGKVVGKYISTVLVIVVMVVGYIVYLYYTLLLLFSLYPALLKGLQTPENSSGLSVFR